MGRPSTRQQAPKMESEVLPAPEAPPDFEAELIAAILRASPRWPEFEKALAPLVEDLALGIAADAEEALAVEPAIGPAIEALVGPPARGNQPPEPIKPEVLRDLLAEKQKELTNRQATLLAGAKRFHEAYETIPNDDVQGNATEFVRQIQAAVKKAEAEHAEAKRPWLDLGGVVQSFFGGLWDPLKKEKAAIEAKMTAYARQVAERAREEARERAAALAREAQKAAETASADFTLDKIEDAMRAAEQAEAAVSEPQAKPADLSRVRGDLGGVSSLVTKWKIRPAANWAEKLAVDYLMPDQAKLDAALKAAQRMPDGSPALHISGAEIYPDDSIRVR